jgi:hypothetical protein
MMKPQRKKALFYEHSGPPGGLCLSSFVVVRIGGKVLVGRMARPEIWVERFFVGEKFAPEYAGSGKYLLPAMHLAWYESPLQAAEWVVKNQLKIPRMDLRLIDVQSHVRGDANSEKEPPHWDICFVYEAKAPAGAIRRLKTLPWFKDIAFVPLSSLSTDDFTRGHGDVLQEAGLLGKR